MASFWFLLVLTLLVESFIPSLASDHHLNSETSNTISASPATPLSTNSPQYLSPYQELSPDISPLLPSPGGALPSPATSSIPTIPSNPSPPNPDDEFLAPGPDSAFAPFGSLPVSSMAPVNLLQPLNLAVYATVATYYSIYHILRIQVMW